MRTILALSVLALLAACGSEAAKTTTLTSPDTGATADATIADDTGSPEPDSSSPVACTSDKQCTALGLVCDTASGTCVACNDTADCPTGTTCKAHTCVGPAAACVTSKDCPAGQICDKANSQCVGCLSAADCNPGESCIETVCAKTSCQPGATRCDAGKHQKCKPDGSGWADDPCPQGQVCAGGACVVGVCSPGVAACDGTKVVTCNANGSAQTSGEDCTTSGKVCVDGKCLAKKCTPGKATCADGETLATCKADGTGYTSIKCAPNTVCDADSCLPVICKPGDVSCVGTSTATCNASGTTFVASTDCKTAGQACLAGKCVAPNCTPGAVQCTGLVAAVCQADGKGWQSSVCNDGDPCTTDTCDPAKGCLATKIAGCGQVNGIGATGGFISVGDAVGANLRVIGQGFTHTTACGSGLCVRGGFGP